MRYFVHYVEDCSPKIKAFKTKQKLQDFIKKFSKKIDPTSGYWIDFSFRGEITSCDDYYRDLLEGK